MTTSERRTWKIRLALAYLTALACVPYISLKTVWLAGGDLGLHGDAVAEMHSTKFVVANAITMGMELVAVLIAFAFTYPWGRRIPALLVLVPIWVGTGLLAPIALGVPLGLAVQAVAGGSSVPAGEGDSGDMSTWVFGVVYGGFIAQAVTLLAAFAFYARGRWPEAFTMDGVRRRPGRPLAFAVNGAAVLALSSGVMQLVWAFSDGRLGADPAFKTVAQKTFVGIGGPLAFAGALGTLALVHRWGTRPAVALVAAWAGTGYLFAWGTFSGAGRGGAGLVQVAGAAAGLLLGLAALLTLRSADRRGATGGEDAPAVSRVPAPGAARAGGRPLDRADAPGV